MFQEAMEFWIGMCAISVFCVAPPGDLLEGESNPVVNSVRQRAPELFRSVPEFLQLEGYPSQTYTVQTEDGYLLTLYRVLSRTGSSATKPPVLFMHSLGTWSIEFVGMGRNRSLAMQMADEGYDVFLGNARGGADSRRHAYLDPEKEAFWNFSFHEIGVYDIPAFIDFVVYETGHEQMYYVGHSMGSTSLIVMLSERPQYNARLRLTINLAPAVFYSHLKSQPVRLLAMSLPAIQTIRQISGSYKPRLSRNYVAVLAYKFCRDGAVTQGQCEALWKNVFGDSDGLNKTELPKIAVGVLTGTAQTNVIHFYQLIRSNKFQQFDYGKQMNLKMYGSDRPPEYNLSNVRVPMALHYSDGDLIVTSEDVENLSKMLSNVVLLRKVPNQKFNHLDFSSHMNVKHLLYDSILDHMEHY